MTGKRWLKIFGITIGTIVLLLVALAAALYYFGGMWPPSDEMRARYGQMVEAGQAAPVEERFTIPIPGCVCHSDDPALTMAHSTRRISECGACHERVGPPAQ